MFTQIYNVATHFSSSVGFWSTGFMVDIYIYIFIYTCVYICMNYDDMQPEPRDPVVLAFLGTENGSLGSLTQLFVHMKSDVHLITCLLLVVPSLPCWNGSIRQLHLARFVFSKCCGFKVWCSECVFFFSWLNCGFTGVNIGFTWLCLIAISYVKRMVNR